MTNLKLRNPTIYQRSYLLEDRIPPRPIFLIFDFGQNADSDRFWAAVCGAGARHEALRSSFQLAGTDWRVEIRDPDLIIPDLIRGRYCDGEDAVEQVRSAARRLIDPNGGPVLCAGVARVGTLTPRDICWVSVDHMVIDGQSILVLAREIGAAYQTGAYPPADGAEIDYYDFGDSHTAWVATHLDEIRADWVEQFTSGSPYPRLLDDYLDSSTAPEPLLAKKALLHLPAAAIADLEAKARHARMSPYTVLASSFCSAYALAAGADATLSFLTPVGYRSWPGIESTVGYFTTLGHVSTRVGPWWDQNWMIRLGRDVLEATERAVLPFNLMAGLLRDDAPAGLSALERLKSVFPSWPTLIFDVQRTSIRPSTFEPDATPEEGAHRHEVSVSAQPDPLLGPALMATVIVPQRGRGPSELSVEFSGDISEQMVVKLMEIWSGLIA